MSSNERNSEKVFITKKFLPLNMESLTKEIIRKAEVELNETPERKREALEELRRLINTEKEFQPFMDENFLLRFLRAKKFNTEVAFKTLRNFYIFKARYSGILTEIYPTELENVIKMNVTNIQPYRDHEGSMVFIAKIDNLDLSKTSMDELIISSLLTVDYSLQSEVTQICGAIAVYNYKSVSLRLIQQMASPTLLYRFFRAMQDCIPLRIKAIHIINEPFYFSFFFNFVKRFMSQKLRQRLQFHGSNLENFHKHVPPEILPSEFGGHLGPMTSKDLEEALLRSDSYFSEMYKYGYHGNKAESINKELA